jgi:hypothetical protein
MALEATLSSGKKIQSMYVYVRRGNSVSKVLVYREGTSGKWLNTEGISFEGKPRSPENLINILAGSDSYNEIFVLPEL